MNKYLLVSIISLGASFAASAQYLRPGQIDQSPSGTEFRIAEWQKGTPQSDDDNFFISRVKPKARFVNAATQINTKLIPWWEWDTNSIYSEHKDYSHYSKKILNWFPYGFSYSYSTKSPFEILPNGLFNSEVFSMWQYISTWGAWSDRFMRLPGNFADVAHKNGVAVATQSTPAFGADMASNGWGDLYIELGATEESRNKVIEYLDYYGIDGIGYNSEYAGGYNAHGIPEVVELNKAITQHFERKYTGEMKSFSAENIWYDGETLTAGPTFDNGVTPETEIFFGDADNKTASYFLNYNWNANFNNGNVEYLPASIEYTTNTLKRNPFDVYATFDLQGGYPVLTGNGEQNGRWQYLYDKAVSIGMWSGHDSNTFWERRFAYGSQPLEVQHTYQRLLERWYTNSHFNPVHALDASLEINENIDNSLDTEFFGLSKMVAAQSTLCWDLSEEPFYSAFNLGNGQYFNWQGIRQHSNEWTNIGIQDYLPTWRWWWAASPLGRDYSSAPVGLRVEFDWNEAWLGGSSLRIRGTESKSAVLHLFKTRFDLQAGDIVTVRYKLAKGSADVALMLGYGEDCSQWTFAQDHIVLSADQAATPEWIEKSFTISEANQLALIALQFDNASDLDVNIGEVSIRRAEYATPDTPTVTSATLLAAHKDGLDAKVIFDLNLAEGNRQGHYNIDHNASLYKIYARINYAESEETTLMGATTSWAALFFSAPYDPVKAKAEGATLSVGVSAVSLDMQSESTIAWSEPMTIDFDTETYIVNDDIEASDTFITDAEQFSIGFKDPLHVPAEGWKLIGPHNNASFETPIELAIDGCHSFKATADIDAETVSLDALPYGTYDIEAYDAEGNVRHLHSAIHIYSDMAVAEPVISSFHPVDTDGDDDAISEVTKEMTTAALDENADYLVVNNDETLSDLKATHTTLPGTGMKLRPSDTLTMQYTAESGAVGSVSRGVNLRGYSLGIPAGQAGVQADIETIEDGEGWEKVTIDESDLKFSVAFWVKFTDLSDPTWLLNIRNPKDAWPYSDWGWLWGTISDDGYLNNISIRSHHNNTFVYDFTDDNGKGKVKFEENAWYHVAYVFDEYKTTESSYYGIITDSERNFSLYVNGQLITPKSITEPKDKAWKDFDPNAIIAVGGTAGVGSFAGYDAVIDNLQFYNVALDADAIASTMGDIDASNPPAGMTALWNFEGDDIYRNALSTYPEAELNHAFSTHSTSMDEIVTVGYPALRGSKTQQTTLIPTLTAADAYATTSDITIDDQGVAHGSAELRFPSLENGTYRIYTPQLTLDNSIGNDKAEYAYIYVVNLDGKIHSGIVGVNADDVAFDVYPNPFSRVLNVAIEKGGEYTLQLVNLEGKLLASKTCEVADKGVLSLDADVDKGVCIAVLIKDKTVVATKKLIKE